MKITAFDPRYSQNLSIGDTYIGGSNGSNSSFAGGDVVGEPGDLSVVGLRSTVALSSNLAGSIGDVLTIIATSPRTAQFATPSNSGSSSLPWFIVTAAAYGATGNGVTDDTAAINLAIAALNAAGRGVLYFPAGSYLCSSALTAITATGTVMGDGMTGSYDGATINPSVLVCSSGSASFLTIAAGTTVRDLALRNTAGSVTAGYGVGGTDMNLCRFERVSVTGFWINFDIDGGLWTASRCYSRQSHQYGFDVSYVASPDGGDWNITDCYIVDGANLSNAGIHITSGGGGKVANTKINSDSTNGLLNGINMSIGSGVVTVDLQLTNCSIENVRGDGMFLETTGTGQFGFVTITGMEVALFSNNTGRAVKVSAAQTGGLGTNGGFSEIMIGDCVFYTSGTPRAAVELIKTNNVVLGDLVISGFNARYTSASDTNTTDGSSVTYATPAIVLGTAAAAGAASSVIRSDSTIVAFDATAPVTQAFSDVAATGSVAFAARRDHKHGMPATPSGSTTHYEILMASGSADPLLTSDGLDYLYVEVPN